MYKLFLSLRYLRQRRIAYIAVGAVMLCVAMVLTVLSVMGGWLDMVKQRARGLLGDVIVDNRDYLGFPLYDEFIREIETWPEIVKATPVIYTWGIFNFRESHQTGTTRVVGLRLQDVYVVNAFRNSLFYEKYYPGTTQLDEQQQPVLGPDQSQPPIIMFDENGEQLGIYPPVLPGPYQQALEQARRQHAEDGRVHGGDPVLVATDEVENSLDKLLREAGLPPLPGEYRLADQPGLVGDPHPGLILGRDIIARREADGRYDRYYPRGSAVMVTLVRTEMSGSVDPIPVKRMFRYVDDSRTGIYEIDSQHVYCDFELLQKLLQMDAAPRVNAAGETVGTAPARCSQIQIKTAAGISSEQLRALTRRMRELYRSFSADPRFELDVTECHLLERIEAMTWQQSQAHIIEPVEKERVLVTILFGIISLVAVALILCILYMIVLQKTRDIGIIKAIGGSSGGVAFIFVMYGAAVGVTGSLLGTVLGTIVVTYINEIQDYLISINPHWRVWDLQVYSFDRIPSDVNPWDALIVVLSAIAAATIGSLAAAWRAGSMPPVEAVRYE